MASASLNLPLISRDIWNRKYRFAGGGGGVAADATIDDTFWRVAHAAALVESEDKRQGIAAEFHAAMGDLTFLPAGRILAGSGTGRNVTLFNCFVLGRIEDDLGAIFNGVKEAALTMQAGGGIGHDFSTLRPRGAPVRSIGADASGPVSFMDVWDSMCRTIMSAGQRRGAMMATLRCDHPDIDDFIAAKSDPRRLRNFNLSVLVTDAFIAAVRARAPWPLQFEGTVYRTVDARALWDKLMRATYDYAEPGVIFIDRVNALNNLSYCETISATNPCGEQPLPPYGACLLGSINLARLVSHPFEAHAAIDVGKLQERVSTAVRLLDNVIDVSGYPLEAQRTEALAKRRIGLGITGLADALIFCGLRYGSPAAAKQAQMWMRTIQNAAYRASSELAREKGSFPLFDRDEMLARPNIAALDTDVRAAIVAHGLRNGCLTSIAPAGTISLLAGNVSSGAEPVFAFEYTRNILGSDGKRQAEQLADYAFAVFREKFGDDVELPAAFVSAAQLQPAEHIAMQAALQPYVDSAISKTVNCPRDIPFTDFTSVYLDAFDSGLKGCTTYRPNDVTGAVLEAPAPVTATTVATAAATVTTPVRKPAVASQGSSGGIVYMAKPLERDHVLEGSTYKLRWPGSAHALYVTINDIEVNGRRRPFEIFINTKNLEHYAWTVALTRMISAVFRRGGDVSFVAEELRAVFDPEGGRWIDGRYVPSLLAAIGDVISRHMQRIGFTADAESAETMDDVSQAAVGIDGGGPAAFERRSTTLSRGIAVAGAATEGPAVAETNDAASLNERAGKPCPRCGQRSFVRREGCWTCLDCLYAQCN